MERLCVWCSGVVCMLFERCGWGWGCDWLLLAVQQLWCLGKHATKLDLEIASTNSFRMSAILDKFKVGTVTSHHSFNTISLCVCL